MNERNKSAVGLVEVEENRYGPDPVCFACGQEMVFGQDVFLLGSKRLCSVECVDLAIENNPSMGVW